MLERSPSGDFYKFQSMGWISKKELSYFTLLEVLGSSTIPKDSDEPEMCPNCLTPWKCNGPHVTEPCRGAPGGSHQLERYLDALELSRYGQKDRVF